MNTFDIIKRRRTSSPVCFTDETISDKQIKKLLEAARWAPTHKLTEPWRFVVVRGDALNRLADFMQAAYENRNGKPLSAAKMRRKRHKILNSQAVLLIVMQRDPDKRIPEWEEIASVACAVNNIWIYAAENNLGGYWSSPFYIDQMDQFTLLENGERCLGMFYLGVIDEKQEDNRKRNTVEYFSRWITK